MIVCSASLLLVLPNLALATTYTATADLYALDHSQHSVPDVYFNIYKQERDYGGNYVLGSRITGGKMNDSGHQLVGIKMSSNWNMQIAIEYYVANKPNEKFVVWDKMIVAQESRTIYLPFSSVSIVLKEANGGLLKNFKFDVYSAVTDVLGAKFADRKLYSSQTTGVTGEKKYYLAPGNYVVKIQYPEVKNVAPTEYSFQIATQKRTYVDYRLSNIKIAVKDGDTWKNKTEFKLYKKQEILNETAYQEIGKFNTGTNYKMLYLPNGDYKIEFKGSDNKYSKAIDFSLGYGQSKDIVYNLATKSKIVANNLQNPYLDSDSLYNIDSDSDLLADFEEYYMWNTNPFNADSDSDGYSDYTEVKTGFNPNGSGLYTYTKFSYGRPRLKSPSMEKDLAVKLKAELETRLGRSIGVHAKDWDTIVNAYIYGGYSIDEIKNTLVYGPGMVHPTIPASSWRKR